MADTEEAHRLAFNRAFAENHLLWKWDVSLYGKLLRVTGGKERIKHYVETCRPVFHKPNDYEGFVKRLHQLKTSHYTAMLSAGRIPLRPNIKRLITEAKQAGLKLAIATTTSPENVATLLQQGLGEGGRGPVRCHRLRRHRAQQKTCARHLPVGAGAAPSKRCRLYRSGRFGEWAAFQPGCRCENFHDHQPLHAPPGFLGRSGGIRGFKRSRRLLSPRRANTFQVPGFCLALSEIVPRKKSSVIPA